MELNNEALKEENRSLRNEIMNLRDENARIRDLEKENAKLKQEVLELSIDRDIAELYQTRSLVCNTDVVEFENILAVDYRLKAVIPAITRFGFDAVNEVVVKKAKEVDRQRKESLTIGKEDDTEVNSHE